MAATQVVARGPWVFLLTPGAPGPRVWRARPRAGLPARPAADASVELEPVPGGPTVEGEATWETWGTTAAEKLSVALGRTIRRAERTAWSAAAGQLPPWAPDERRAYLLARARAELDTAIRSPEEIVISLAREEARFERAVEREERAAETFVSPPGTVLAEQARAWEQLRGELRAHHQGLRTRLEKEARLLLPNLTAIVGERVAARLLAAAGGLSVLTRMSSSRLQLLGTRRRPSPERGPRYGLLYRADCLEEVPPDRRAAFARSVAALAVIAARADGSTRRDLTVMLLGRRERRARELRRAGR